MAASQVVVLGPRSERTAMVVDRFQKLAAEHGGAVEIAYIDSSLPEDDIIARARDCIAIIPMGVRSFARDFIRQLPNLRLIQTTSAGTDWIDRAYLGELGIRVANNGGGNRVAVSEHTIALMVAAYRKLDHQIRSARERRWSSDIPGALDEFHTLEEKRVGIIGLGRIGKAVAKRLRGWDCEIVYHDILTMSPEVERDLNVAKVPMDDLLATSDVVTLHVPLDRSTRHMIGERELGLMKETAILINACRGPVVDERALIAALRSGAIAGAGLDVLEQEPPSGDNPLLDMQNVIVTPHAASRAVESMLTSSAFAIANVSRLARGEEPESIVPPV